MTGFPGRARRHGLSGMAMLCSALLLCACSLTAGKVATGVAPPVWDQHIEDVSRIPQQFAGLTKAAGDRLTIGAACRAQLLDDFQRRFFAPWTSSVPLLDPAELRDFMKKEARGSWYGVNKRKIEPKQLQGLLENCAVDAFPSRNDTAVAVAPAHLRGLPTHLPFYERADGCPFDMLSYPQVKLNEPLRVLHVSRDGGWLFVETGSSNGWLEARDAAFVDRTFIESWMQGPHLVIVRDLAPVADGRGMATFRPKIGTILPLARAGEGWWEVKIASAGEGGKAEIRPSRISSGQAAPFPLAFDGEQVALIGDQLLGQPYGWGEAYDLRDCSAMLRDFFLPFGIWMPRTSGEQLASIGRRIELAALAPPEKEEQVRTKALPFLTLLYKPGHVMLYVGVDGEGRPLVFHNAWSIRLKGDGAGERTQIIGVSVITTLEPGKELGLVSGTSLLERATELATVTERCEPMPQQGM